jgi:hypothetical protein
MASTGYADEAGSGAGWSWANMLERAQTSAKDLAVKAQEIAEVAGKVAQEKAVVIAARAQEMRQNYDVDTATSNFLSAVGAVPQNGDKFRPSYTDNRPNRPIIRSDVLDLVYFTENLVGMAFPCDPTKPCNADGGNDINAVAKFLKVAHEGRFMIWNISEESYDYSLFNDQVLEYKFPGHPAPPLGMLFKICTSIESWLDADERNVAVIHCLTGKGRTAALAACVLTWIGEFAAPMEALQYVAERRKTTVDNLTIPSQQRYVQYFANMLDGVKPRSEPLLLRRVIINSIPIFGDNCGSENSAGCCPYIQIFKCGRLIATAVPAGSEMSGTDRGHGLQLKWINSSEGSVSFVVDVAMQGDLLLRCRHADASGVRVSMFRAAFHTGYVPSGVLRLTKAQLDGSHSDARYNNDFFVDLIFAPIEKAVPLVGAAPSATSGTAVAAVAPTDSGITLDPVTSDKYELTLHRDSRFWDAVASRKLKSKKRRSRKYTASVQEHFSIGDEPHSPAKTSASAGLLGSLGSLGSDLLGFGDNAEPAPAASCGTSMADLDLIQQLANAESSNFSRTTNGGTTTPNLSAVDELQALDLLEQELGLGLGSSAPSTPSHSRTKSSDKLVADTSTPIVTKFSRENLSESGTKSKSDDIDLDNLEDLENYLNSLSSK